MTFNIMGFFLGREMAKRELGSAREDRANQLGLVGAMTPDPMMGAVMAMMIARNEAPSTGAPAAGTSAPILRPPPTEMPLKLLIEDAGLLKEQSFDKPIDFLTRPIGRHLIKVHLDNVSGRAIDVTTRIEGKPIFSGTELLDIKLQASGPGKSIAIDLVYNFDRVGGPHTGELWIYAGDPNGRRIELRGATSGPKLRATFEQAGSKVDWKFEEVLTRNFKAGDVQPVELQNSGSSPLEFTVDSASVVDGFQLLDESDQPINTGVKIIVDAGTEAQPGAKKIKVKRPGESKDPVNCFLFARTNDPATRVLVAVLKKT